MLYKISSTSSRNITLASKCMANKKISDLLLHDRYSDSQCIKNHCVEDISDLVNIKKFELSK